MQSDHLNIKSILTLKGITIALLIALFATLVVLAVPHALSGSGNDAECLNGSTDCVTKPAQRPNLIVWGGVYLCSLLGLILMTFKSNGEKRPASNYITLASAAALNTVMWMAFVYAGAFLFKLF